MRKAISWISMIFLLTLIAGGIVACLPIQSTPAPAVCQQLDIPFRDFCNKVGAEKIGTPISPLFEFDGQECQFTTNVLLCYETKQLSRVKLFPLSRLLYFGAEANFVPEGDQSCQLDADFQPLENKITNQGVKVGQLLTCPIYDYSGGQKYQFRENVAYAISLTDPEAQPSLMNLGKMACDQYGGCEKVLKNGKVQPTEPLPCTAQLDRLGLGDLTGQLTAVPFATDECDHVVIFAGIAFCMSDDCMNFRALPLGSYYGISTDPVPYNEQYAYRSRFYVVQGDLGYHVLSEIDFFITEHGGYEISGQPISEAYATDNPAIWRQCFQNYCVEYDMTLPRGQNIKLVPLGDVAGSRLEPELLVRPVYSRFNVNFFLSEKQPYLARGSQQTLTLNVFNAQNQPIEDLNFTLTLKSGDGVVLGEYPFPETDVQGVTQLILGPIEGQSGDIFEYSVCLDLPTAFPMCETGTYILWP